MHLLCSSIQPNMKWKEWMTCQLVIQIYEIPQTPCVPSQRINKQRLTGLTGEKKQWCHVTQTLCTYMRVTNRLKITQRGLRQNMPGGDVFFNVGAGHWAARVWWESPSHNSSGVFEWDGRSIINRAEIWESIMITHFEWVLKPDREVKV